ncbi:hypothetical protein KDAU_53330 [Dictyobacter aurantiacus]|uniref:Uncharacterized protein n=1 Tax=Dictyobacter aurantiacus TaxID=1936993 RepID=A0A401ZMF7_9CHLR|nr:hypothetical protein KDAU_53330 [Dictyobacter aurantiacus]
MRADLLYFSHYLLAAVGIDIGHHHLRAILSQAQGCGCSDPSTSSGDKSYSSFMFRHDVMSFHKAPRGANIILLKE